MLQTDLSGFSYKKGTLVPLCKRCGLENFWRDGKVRGMQRYKCRDCGFRFVWTSDLPRRNYFSEVISFAVELYTSPRMCASLRGVARIIQKAFAVVVSHQTIREWVLAAKIVIPQRVPRATVRHADETYIKIKGKGCWLWIVRCRETGEILSWRISTTFEPIKKVKYSRFQMVSMHKGIKKMLAVVIVALLVLFFYPTKMGSDQGSFWPYKVGDQMTTVTYKCLGIKTNIYSNCEDCGSSTFCFGLKHSKECLTEELQIDLSWKTVSSECEDYS